MAQVSIDYDELPRAARCPQCDGVAPHWLHVPGDWRRPRLREAFELYWCGRCAYGFLHPPRTPEATRAAYRVEYYTRSIGEDRDPPKRSPLAWLREHLAFRLDGGEPLTAPRVHGYLEGRPARICDMGSGNGDLLYGLRQLGHDVVGIEPDPEAARVARLRKLQVVEAMAEDLPESLPRRSFDAVIANHVLEHCREPRRAVYSVGRLLQPGGLLVCDVPNSLALGAIERGACWPFLDVPRHLHFFTERSLSALLRGAAFRLRAVEYHGYGRHLSEPWVESDRRIGRVLGALDGHASLPPYLGELRAWSLLLRTGFAADEQKYDSVRVLAVAP